MMFLACPTCSGAKSDRTHDADPESGESVSFFNPRLDSWIEHFVWLEEGAVIAGLTPKGRATVTALNMNHPDSVAARRLWVEAGWHPPADTL
ncbi:MAG: HNH endonuclease [Chloroflexota bacterium]